MTDELDATKPAEMYWKEGTPIKKLILHHLDPAGYAFVLAAPTYKAICRQLANQGVVLYPLPGTSDYVGAQEFDIEDDDGSKGKAILE